MVIVNDLQTWLGMLAFLVLQLADFMLVGSQLLEIAASVASQQGEFFF